jgi:negative regulator of sigma-B (phosphoserine phosphatase)
MVTCGVALRALPGQLACGDAHVVAPFPGGTLVAAVDGLGHGPEAAEAARLAVAAIARCATQSVSEIVIACHKALKKTRGAAVSLVSFCDADATMVWLGVGNVDAVLVRAIGGKREHLFLRGGIVGHNLPEPRPAVLRLERDDTVILATDGVRAGFATGVELNTEPEALARRILHTGARVEDDALVLVARYSVAA